MSLPCTLLPTRNTDFEVVTHTLYIGALSPSPEYLEDDETSVISTQPSKGRSSTRRMFSFGGKKSSSSEHIQHAPIQQDGPNTEITSLIFGPTIASYKEEIRVVAPLLQKGQLSIFEVVRKVPIHRLGALKLDITTNYVSPPYVLTASIDADFESSL